MSLYFETAALLTNADNIGGSFKARIFKKKDLKSKPGQIYALVAEASKWSKVLSGIVEGCGILGEERKLTPILALLLTHDLLLSKSGVAAPKDHVLRLAISRHKARLAAAFTKARIKHGFATVEAFRAAINGGDLDADSAEKTHPRWVRVNTIKTSLVAQLSSTFKDHVRVETIGEILTARGSAKVYFQDTNIPDLLALPGRCDLTKTPAYVNGELIFQDKASCFPAYLLDLREDDGDVIDGCAAPGNKTTHAAALVAGQKVIAFERDKGRTAILQKMVKLAGADHIVTIKGASDFIAAKLNSPDYENVGAILLDPSCSGTGIVGRDDAIKMHLPSPLAAPTSTSTSKPKKRKRGAAPTAEAPPPTADTNLTLALDDAPTEEETALPADKLQTRLTALSTFQLHILTHAMRFPSARKITYSTCSLHFEENEGVVFQALATAVAKERGWRVLKRAEQVDGLKNWERRGVWEEGKLAGSVAVPGRGREEVLEGCIRCEKGGEEGTMGFFVAGFVRDDALAVSALPKSSEDASNANEDVGEVRRPAAPTAEQDGDEEEEWDGFSDEEKVEELKAVAEKAVAETQTTKTKTTVVPAHARSDQRGRNGGASGGASGSGNGNGNGKSSKKRKTKR